MSLICWESDWCHNCPFCQSQYYMLYVWIIYTDIYIYICIFAYILIFTSLLIGRRLHRNMPSLRSRQHIPTSQRWHLRIVSFSFHLHLDYHLLCVNILKIAWFSIHLDAGVVFKRCALTWSWQDSFPASQMHNYNLCQPAI